MAWCWRRKKPWVRVANRQVLSADAAPPSVSVNLSARHLATSDLAAFRNQFNEKFRAGGFFATERPDSLVRVQIETPESLIGLTVVRDRVY